MAFFSQIKLFLVIRLLRIREWLILFHYGRLVTNRVGSYLHPISVMGKSIVTRNTHLGRNVNFNGMVIVGNGDVHIGSNFHSGIECRIITQNHNYNGGKAIPYDETYILKSVIIEDNVWIGDRVMILGGVRIGEGAIIQAGSVVTSNIPACSIAGGHPAKVFAKRDEAHYYKLKSENKFH